MYSILKRNVPINSFNYHVFQTLVGIAAMFRANMQIHNLRLTYISSKIFDRILRFIYATNKFHLNFLSAGRQPSTNIGGKFVNV